MDNVRQSNCRLVRSRNKLSEVANGDKEDNNNPVENNKMSVDDDDKGEHNTSVGMIDEREYITCIHQYYWSARMCKEMKIVLINVNSLVNMMRLLRYGQVMHFIGVYFCLLSKTQHISVLSSRHHQIVYFNDNKMWFNLCAQRFGTLNVREWQKHVL